MKKFIKNKKGVTLISLVITTIVLAILLSVAGFTGKKTYDDARYYKIINNLRIMQSEVNKLYEKYQEDKSDSNPILEMGAEVPSSLTSQAHTAFNSAKTNNLTSQDIGSEEDFRFFSFEYVKNNMNIEDTSGIECDYLVNIKSRAVILINGVKRNSKMYYSLYEIEGEQHNVEYINPVATVMPNGGIYKIQSGEESTTINATIMIDDIPVNKNITVKYAWSRDFVNEPALETNWETDTHSGNTVNVIKQMTEEGSWYLWVKIIDSDTNKELNTDVSEAFIVKK